MPVDKNLKADMNQVSAGRRKDTGESQAMSITEVGSLNTSLQDAAGRQAANTVFGDQIFGQRVPTVSSQFHYPLETGRSIVELENGGSINNNDSQLRLTTDTQVNSKSIVTGKFFLRYIPGHEAYSFFTIAFNTPTSGGSYQRIGLFDGTNGFYVGFEGSHFVLGRIREGVRTTQIVTLKEVFPDGSFNPEMGNVYKISFGYLGFATVAYEVMTPEGGWVTLGKINYPNTSKETHVGTTYLPIRAELFNGTSAEAMEITSGSVTTGIIDGAGEDPGARRFSFATGVITTSPGNNRILILKNKPTFASLENRVNMKITLVSASTEGNKPVAWRIIENPTITTPGTFTDVNTADSIMSYSTDEIIDFNSGKNILNWNMAKTDGFFEQINEQSVIIRPGDYIAIIANSSQATETTFSLRWEELF